MNENKINLVKKVRFDKTLFSEKDSILDKCPRDSHNIYFHKLKFECINDMKLINIINIGVFKLIISGKCMDLCELKKRSKVAGQNGSLIK